MQGNNYELLISKLDEFIRRYYLNQLLKGVIYASTLVLALFLFINSVEYFMFLSPLGRKILLFGFIGVTGFVSYRWIFIPLLHYYQLGGIISHEQAANIIGKHFSSVQDRLLNILQLKKQSETNADASLINASISQKIEQLKPIPFTTAIDLNSNRKYLRYLAVPVLALVAILFTAPSIISEGSRRLIHNSTPFEKPAPFQFSVLNKDMKAIQYADFDLDVTVNGKVLPDQVYVKQNGNSFKMVKKSATAYSYKFANLQKDAEFVLTAVGFDSKEYTIKVLPKPMIVGFQVALNYPMYTGKKDEVIQNVGDLTIPAGTRAVWSFNAKDTKNIGVKLSDSSYNATRNGESQFTFTKTFKQTSPYTLKVSSDLLKDADSITYTVNVVPDQFPTIDVKPVEDTVAHSYIYFMGSASDDYGVRNVNLAYKISQKGMDAGSNYKTIPITFPRNSKSGEFSYYWETNSLDLKPGDNVNYYFEAWDNDAVNGSKSTHTQILSFKVPTKEEIDSMVQKGNESIKSSLSSSMSKAENLQKKASDLRDKMTEKKDLSWEDKKQLEDLVKKEKGLENDIKDFQKQLDENMARQDMNKEAVSESLKEKQEKLKDLFDHILNDETKALFNKLDSMLAQTDKKDVMDQLENFKMNNEQLEKEMDRMLALFKQVEFEQKLDETIQDLNKLAKDQEDLSKKTEAKEKPKDELAKNQQDIKNKFDDVKKNMNDLKDINQKMDNPATALDKPQEDMKQADQDLKESEQALQSNEENKSGDSKDGDSKNSDSKSGKDSKSSKSSKSGGKDSKSAAKSQKDAANDMKAMADDLQQMKGEQEDEQDELNIKAIRQLLKNLVQLSFDQEDIMNNVGRINTNSPDYVAMMKNENRIKDNSEMVQDSLYALAKRVIQIESFVTKEMRDINRNIKKGVTGLEDRNKPVAITSQQYVMTGFNNLALMLSEVMDQLQQSQAKSKPGMGQCKKPGKNNKPGMGSLGQMQKELNKQIQELAEKKQQQGPPKPGGKKPGDKEGESGENGNQMSKELAQAAAKQKAIRQALQKLADQENKDGKKTMGDMGKTLDEMNKTETELVNKQLTTEMIKRQQEIQTRLLEAEDALKEREMDKERKAETAKEVTRKIPPSLAEYLKKRDAEIQLYKTVPPALKPYYKNLVESYFKTISF